MASRKRQCYRQWAGKASATDQLSIKNQHVEDLITTPTGQEGRDLEGADDKALEGASTIHNYSEVSSQFDHEHPRFFRIRRRHCPNFTFERQIPHLNAINGLALLFSSAIFGSSWDIQAKIPPVKALSFTTLPPKFKAHFCV
jgi:hypothetical protein